MKKPLLFIVLSAIILIAPLIASAQITLTNPLKYDTIEQVIAAVANFIAVLSSSVAVIMIIWAGIVYMTAGDNRDKTESAKKTIMWALIGMAIIWSAKFLIDAVSWILGRV